MRSINVRQMSYLPLAASILSGSSLMAAHRRRPLGSRSPNPKQQHLRRKPLIFSRRFD